MPLTQPVSLQFQPRNLTLLRGLFESLVMTTPHSKRIEAHALDHIAMVIGDGIHTPTTYGVTRSWREMLVWSHIGHTEWGHD